MKNTVFAVCVILLVIQSTVIDAGCRKQKEKGHMATPEHQARISDVVQNGLSPDCSATIKRYGKSTSTIEENCTKLDRYGRFLGRKGCKPEDLDKLKNVIGCDGDDDNVQYQQDATTVTPGKSSVTQAVNAATPTATSGSQGSYNVTEP